MTEPTPPAEQDLVAAVRDLERRLASVESQLADIAYSVGVPKRKQ